MKKLIPLIVPIVIAFLLHATTFAEQTNYSGNVTVSYSSDLKNWNELVDITGHVERALEAGLTELHLEVSIGIDDKNVSVIPADSIAEFSIHSHDIDIKNESGFFRAESNLAVSQTLDLATPSSFKLIPKPGCGAGLAIGIMILILAGIIIYLLVKTCQRLLP